jgi:hypothetical protein
MSSELTIATPDATVITTALNDMHTNLRSVIGQIDEMIAEHHAANIMTMWRVGELINEIDTNPENYLTEAQQTQHMSPSALLTNFFHKAYPPEQFETARRLYEAYAILCLVNSRCPARPNWRLTATHVQLLLAIPDAAQRKVVETKCVKEALTTRALSLELSETRGPAKKTQTKMRAPRGLKQRVFDLLEYQRKFIARSEKLWLSDDGLYDALMNSSPTQLTDTIRGYLANANENFDKLSATIQEHQAMIRAVSRYLEKIDSEAETKSAECDDPVVVDAL